MIESHDKISFRIAHILVKLIRGENIKIKDLANEFNVSIRTIQRDLTQRLHDFVEKKGQGYRLNSSIIKNLDHSDFKELVQLANLEDIFPNLLKKSLSEILVKDKDGIYIIKPEPYENLVKAKKDEIFDFLEFAIENRIKINFVYNDKNRLVNPYKLINKSRVWYLLALDNAILKHFSISKMENLKLKKESRFDFEDKYLDIINNSFDLNWINSQPKEAVLEVLFKNCVKNYFLRKDIFPNKKIIKSSDESLIFSVKYSYDGEILQVVKQWIPYMKIISPIELKEKLITKLQNYLKEN